MNYETGVLLGRGGMGEVYKAFDPKLQRHIALKVLRVYSAEAAERLLREARAQAQLDHPHICKVYEVGEDPEQPHIAMQLIDGLPLDQACLEMTLEQRVRVVAQVAEAVHVAHRTGMIHRDLKPANILVERSEGPEGFHPYVVDFGLVYQEDATSLTVEGAVLGTPPYMAPEQAEGSTGAADRRSDVYSLGAALYQALTGEPVFSGSPTELLIKTLSEEPQPPRRVQPQLPIDLETIVLKCLEKEPRHRYASARALAEDLERFLDGEPILAVPASLSSRIAKKVRKHRTLAAVAVMATLAVLASAALAFQARWQAAQRAQAAQRFTAEVKDLEWLMRASRMSPRHDIRPQEQQVRERMALLEGQAEGASSALSGPVHYALGRGFLSLGDEEQARRFLEKAWEEDFRPPEEAYALGLVYGRLFEKELDSARGIADRRARAAAEEQARQQFRDPALEKLVSSRGGAAVIPSYVEGLIAFYEGDFDSALSFAARALEEAPWLFEAEILAGDVLSAQGNRHRSGGEHEAAVEQYRQAQEAYRRASAMAQSATLPYERLCDLAAQRMELEVYGRGGDVKDLLEAGLLLCNQGLEVNPDAPGLLMAIATLWRVLSVQQADRGSDPSLAAAKVLQYARRAVELDPLDARGWQEISWVHGDQARLLSKSGGDPRREFEAAIEAGKRATALARNPAIFLNTVGAIYNRLGEYQMGSGEDPTESFHQAIDHLNQSTELDPGYGYAFNNLGRSHTFLARFESSRGRDPRPELAKAVEANQRAVALNEENAYGWNNLGVAQMDLGRVTFERGEDPAERLAQAIESFDRSLSINPAYASAHNNLGMSQLFLARYQVSRGLDPAGTLAAAQPPLRETIQLHPRAFQPHVNLGRVESIQGRYEMESGGDPRPALQRARGHFEDALQLHPRYRAGMTELAETWLLEAEWYRNSSREKHRSQPGRAGEATALDRAERWLTEALAIDNEAASTFRGLAAVALGRAHWSLGENGSPDRWLRTARQHLDRALEIQPGEPESCSVAARWARLESQRKVSKGEDSPETLEWGLARAEEGLEMNPNYSPLLVARGGILLDQATLSGDSDAARRALADLERAVSLNSNLQASLAARLGASRQLVEAGRR
ncbi:MAG: protein kinase [Deltaproteobacteria bacterium]|nr:protein kinase [Deltaproteobacteria bacterium]